MNFNIAVCDDETIVCKSIFKILNNLAIEKNITVEIDCFTTGEDFCKELQNVKYDLTFLDIELPKMNGVEVGKYIRNNLHNEKIQIAYISSKQEYAMELFETRPINFLVKPISTKKIKEIINKLIILSNTDTEIFTFKNGHSYIKLYLSEILYFYSSGRKINIVTTNASYSFYSSLDVVYKRLEFYGFLYIHKSFIVNYKYIKKYEYEQMTMINKKIISISQSHRKAVRNQFMKLKEAEMI